MTLKMNRKTLRISVDKVERYRSMLMRTATESRHVFLCVPLTSPPRLCVKFFA